MQSSRVPCLQHRNRHLKTGQKVPEKLLKTHEQWTTHEILQSHCTDTRVHEHRGRRFSGSLEPHTELDAASAALDRFLSSHTEIITLSRRNSDVRSLALSLGDKRTVTAECEARLQALEEALANHAFTATR